MLQALPYLVTICHDIPEARMYTGRFLLLPGDLRKHVGMAAAVASYCRRPVADNAAGAVIGVEC